MIEIFIEGEIAAGAADNLGRQLAEAGQQPVLIHINSQGGDVDEAFRMVGLLDNYTAAKNIQINGSALSAAALLLCANGAFVMIQPHGLIMVHRCWTALSGNADELQKQSKSLQWTDSAIIKVLQRRLSKTALEIEAMLSRETWFSSTEALDAGLVDSIIRADKNAAPLALGRFAATAPPIKAPAKSELEAILEKIRRQVAGEPVVNIESLLKEIRDLLTGGAGDKAELENLRAAYRETWVQSAGPEFRNTAGNSYPQKPSAAQLQREIFNQVSGGYRGN